VDRLRQLAQRQIEAEDPQATELWDASVHRLIAQGARNRPLLTAYALLDNIRRNADWVAVRARTRTESSIEVSHAQHMAIIDAIGRGQPDAARQAMYDHLATRSAALLAALNTPPPAEI
jgi:GntR family transcriptional repressor for pyruvate dehydrogenase complex